MKDKIKIVFRKPEKERRKNYIEKRKITPVEVIIGNAGGNIDASLVLSIKKLLEKDEKRKPYGKYDTVEFPDVRYSFRYSLPEVSDYDLVNFEARYPLIPKDAKTIDDAIAYADIRWDDSLDEMVYHVVEPELDDRDRKTLSRIRELVEEKLEVELIDVSFMSSRKFLESKINEVLNEMGIVDGKRRRKYTYYMLNEFVGYGRLEAIMADRNIEDISCDGVGIPVYVYHRNPILGSIRTNVVFNSSEELDEFVMKLAEKAGKTVSVAKPLLDEALPDGSRVQLTLGTDIAHKGSNFTIRRFTEEPFTPLDLIKTGVLDIPAVVYLWFLIEHNSSILISGGTGTGKTTMLNALSLFIKPQLKIVSIEDTPELRLPHPHWVPEVARNVSEGRGTVSMFDLLKESLRQRPDFIIVGEVRGKEASVLFQQIATGHAGMATIHADSFEKLVDRLVTPPIDLSPSLLENLDLIIFLKRIKYHNIYVRRTDKIHEMVRFDREAMFPLTHVSVSWNASGDSYDHSDSYLLKKTSESFGIPKKKLEEEFRSRAKVIDWMISNGVSDYREFSRIVNMYYNKKDLLMVEMGEA